MQINTRYLALVTLILALSLIPTSYAMLKDPKAIDVTTYGIFDAAENGNLVDQLYVGEKYWFYIEYENTLDATHDISIFLQMIDKNKIENNVLKKIEGHALLEPSTGIFNGLEDGFEWTPEYAGQFKLTATFTALDDPLIEVIAPPYDFVVMDRPSLKQQIKAAVPIDDIICKISTHYLIKRSNDKLACIDFDTAKKLDLKPLDSDVMFLDSAMKESLSMRYKDQPEVVAFYQKYPDAVEEVRYDHISYVAGSDDDFKIRMNLFFKNSQDNYSGLYNNDFDLDYIDLKCYFQREHQTDVAESFILKYLKEYTCEKSDSSNTKSSAEVVQFDSNRWNSSGDGEITTTPYDELESSRMSVTQKPDAPMGHTMADDHQHASILVKIFGDKFDFSLPSYQIRSSWIHFEGNDGNTIHRHSKGIQLGYLFDTLNLGLSTECFVFQDKREFCTNDDYTLKFYINGNKVADIQDYVVMDKDMILISYGPENTDEITEQLMELESQELVY